MRHVFLSHEYGRATSPNKKRLKTENLKSTVKGLKAENHKSTVKGAENGESQLQSK